MTCREFVEFLDRYFQGELSPEVAARFEAHLAACPSCVSYAQSYRKLPEMARRALVGDRIGDDVPEELVQAILATRQSSQPR